MFNYGVCEKKVLLFVCLDWIPYVFIVRSHCKNIVSQAVDVPEHGTNSTQKSEPRHKGNKTIVPVSLKKQTLDLITNSFTP